MEKAVVVVADVDTKNLIREAVIVVYWLWLEGKIGQDSLEIARRIKEDQGNHEAEVSCGGEADLHRQYKRCKKNPGHCQFIPVREFSIEHLPSAYRDNDILDLIRAEADLACRLSVRYTSERRPKIFPDREPSPYPFYKFRGCRWWRAGTGCVNLVFKYTEKDSKLCECDECNRPGTQTPKKLWGEVQIFTASHVVYNCEEARRTKCHLFYDTSSIHMRECPTLTGLKVVTSHIQGDMCMFTCITHDMELVDTLLKMVHRRDKLREKVLAKFGSTNDYMRYRQNDPGPSWVMNPTPCPVFIISHPHGCSKHITLGEWTFAQRWSMTMQQKLDDRWEAEVMLTNYRYDAATCPGSSGAPVFRLPVKDRWRWWMGHPHSEGCPGNDNTCVIATEIVSPPTPRRNNSPARTVNFSEGNINFSIVMDY